MSSPEQNWPTGIKRTKQRENVLEVLTHAEKPLGAAEIVSRADAVGGGLWLSTVYRILEMFVEKGIVNRIAVMNTDTAVYELKRPEHKHYAVCVDCHKIIPMEHCPIESFFPHLQEGDFVVIGHHLEVFGYCRDCARVRREH